MSEKTLSLSFLYEDCKDKLFNVGTRENENIIKIVLSSKANLHVNAVYSSS